MAEGDLDAVMSVYDADAVSLNQSREVTKGREELQRELAPLVARKGRFEFTIKQIVEADDIALMHTHWTVSGPQPMQVHAIEIARRLPDGTWRWLIGDPFTVAEKSALETRARSAAETRRTPARRRPAGRSTMADSDDRRLREQCEQIMRRHAAEEAADAVQRATPSCFFVDIATGHCV